jgi:hypothetical protein
LDKKSKNTNKEGDEIMEFVGILGLSFQKEIGIPLV